MRWRQLYCATHQRTRKVLTSLIFPHRPHDRRRRHLIRSVQVDANDFAKVFDLRKIKQSFLNSLLVSLEQIRGVELDTLRRQAFNILQGLNRDLSGSRIRISDHRSIIRILGNLGLARERAVRSARGGGDGSVVRFLDPGDELDLEAVVASVHFVQHVCELEDHFHVLDWEGFVGIGVGDFLSMAERLSQRHVTNGRLVHSRKGISWDPSRGTALLLDRCR